MQHQHIIDHIVDWLTAKNHNAKTSGFVVGVSGGIDSALTSTLASLTKLPVLCLEMPIHQPESQVTRAHEHILSLKQRYENVTSARIDLTDTFEQFKSNLPKTDAETEFLALANTRARLRMTTLYYFAGLNKYLVAGTGNKVEDFGVGFYTKYGDGGVDVSPIADLYKSQVYALAKHLNVIDAIIEAKPTDGLWADDRSDEDQLGVSYDDLEWAMAIYNQHIALPEKITDHQVSVLNRYRQLHQANRHKMLPIPICEIPDQYL